MTQIFVFSYDFCCSSVNGIILLFSKLISWLRALARIHSIFFTHIFARIFYLRIHHAWYINWFFFFRYFVIFVNAITVNNRKISCTFKNIWCLSFLDFLYLLQTLRYFVYYLDFTENILILFCHYFYIHYEKLNLHTVITFFSLLT